MNRPRTFFSRRQSPFIFLLGILAVVAIALLFRSPASVAATAKHYTELEFPPLPELQIPEYTRAELDNGLVVYLMEDRELPLVEGTVTLRTGSRFEPADKIGLASLTGQLLRAGGTQARSANELNQLLELRAASVESGIGLSFGSVSFSALSEDLPEVFSLFAEVLRQPTFAADKLEIEKNQQRGAIARRNDNPGSIAEREIQKLIYGDRSPYARVPEYATIDNISREDVAAFYRRYVRPDNMILGIVGDFDTAAMLQRVEETFGSWRTETALNIPPLPEVRQVREGEVFSIARPQLTQSQVQIGHLGGRFDSADFAPLSVMNGVLNGLGGRLFDEIRSRQGLAYSVYGYWAPEYDFPGTFLAGGQTRSETTVPFIRSLIAELEKIQRAPVTAAELSNAKESTLNSFVFKFANPVQILARVMRYEYYDYPADFIFQYQQQVAETTAEDVLRVARKYVRLDRLVTLVVGNSEEIQPPLTDLGKRVRSIDIAIPSPPNA